MLENFRKKQPGAPIWRILWWHFLHLLCFLWFVPMYRFRAWGVRRIPAEGPLLIVSNHQSFFDPIIVGLGSHRRQFAAMARSTLFDHPVFAWLIRSLNAIPVVQGESDLKAIRQCVDVLKKNHALLIFPEGERCEDGVTHRFETGTMLLIKRAKPTILPVALDGAFDAYRRGQKRPKLRGRIGVLYGEPIPAQTLLAMKPEEALAYLQRTVEAMRHDLAERLADESAACDDSGWACEPG